MTSALRNKDGVASNFVDNAMFTSDAARPVPSKLMAQRLWLANAREGMQSDVVQQAFDPLADALVRATPVFDIFPRLRRIEQVIRWRVGQSQPQFLP